MRLLLILCIPFLLACGNEKNNNPDPEIPSNSIEPEKVIRISFCDSTSEYPHKIEFSIFRNTDSVPGGFGYAIFMDTKLYVRQPHIPAIQGNRGFASEEDAAKTARLVSHKIKNGIIPPGVSTGELDSLGIR
jgi:hypothetical protein